MRTRSDWSQFSRVDGDFAGTTDEIIQWAACKWGIDEDIARAQVIEESNWYHSANGDNGESWGLGQVRDTSHQSAFQYSVNARTSAAYNLDYTYASCRACYEGVSSTAEPTWPPVLLWLVSSKWGRPVVEGSSPGGRNTRLESDPVVLAAAVSRTTSSANELSLRPSASIAAGAGAAVAQ